MRALWVTLCSALIAVTYVQAEAYHPRDRDDSFNPLDVMREMPSPMKVFDSSDRRRHDRRRMRPPLHRPPRPGYPGAPYAYPPVAPIPSAPHPQYAAPVTQSGAVSGQAVDPAPQTVVAPPARPGAEHARPVTPTASYAAEQAPGYSFRPMTPLPQDAGEPTPLTASPTPAAAIPTAQAPQPSIPVARPSSGSQESVMVNGKPAVFRPMHLGSEGATE